jgi:hypothetical protein
VLRAALSEAVDEGLIPRSPAARVGLPRTVAKPERVKETEAWTSEQVDRFLDTVAGHRWEIGFRLGVLFGPATYDRDRAAKALKDTGRFARRPARQALADADHRVADADASLQAALQAAAPSHRALTTAIKERDALLGGDVHASILDMWADHDARIARLEERQEALIDWRAWASGEPLTADRIAFMARALHVNLFEPPYDARYAALEDVLLTWSGHHLSEISARELTTPEPAPVERSGIELDI